MLSAVFSARAQKLAVNTDVLMDACMIPSVGLEMTVGNWSTLGLNVLGCNKPYGKNIKLLQHSPNTDTTSLDVRCIAYSLALEA